MRVGDRNVTVPMAQAIVRSLAVNAAKGQHRAQCLFAEMLTSTERQNKLLADEWLQTAIEYKIEYKGEWERELEHRARLGITDLPEPVPHPDHVRIDFDTGQAWVAGPSTKEKKRNSIGSCKNATHLPKSLPISAEISKAQRTKASARSSETT